MFLQQYYSLIHFIFLLLPLALSSKIAKPRCPELCGNLPIPFPFGVGSGCFLEPNFEVTCNTSTNPPKAYLPYYITYSNYTEIIEINQTGQIRIKYPYPLVRACYPSNSTDFWYGFFLDETPYTLSDKNWVTTIGCDDLVLLVGSGNETVSGGCVSYCSRNHSSGNGTCPNNVIGYSAGIGCCRTPIPKGDNQIHNFYFTKT